MAVKRSAVLKTGAVAATVAILAAACGGGSSKPGSGSGSGSSGDKNTRNTATVNTGGKVTWTIEKTMTAWNPLSGAGNTFDFVQVLNPIYPGVYIPQPDYTVALNKDLMDGDPTFTAGTASAPQTVVYKIKPNAVWSDGTPISADDFVYNWEAQNGTNPAIDAATTTGYSDIATVAGSADGKTVTATWKPGKAFPDWKSLFSNLLPAHIAKQHGDTAASWEWFNTNVPTVSGGQFTIQSVSPDNTTATLVRNPKFYGVPAKLDTVVFRAITDSGAEPNALANGEVDGIYPQPQLDLVTRIKAIPNVTSTLDSGLQFEHIDMNLKNTSLGNATYGTALRTAMFTAFDRKGLIARTVGQFDPSVTPLNNRMLVPGQAGYQDNVTSTGIGSGDVAKAKAALTAAGFTGVGTKLVSPDGKEVPAFNFRYTVGNAIRQNTATLFQSTMKELGITVNVASTDSLSKTLDNADSLHTYDIIVFAWVATPFFASASQPLYTTQPAGNPGNNYGFYSNADVDKALDEAAVSPDQATQLKDLNAADLQISKDAYTLPLYQKPTIIAFKNTLGNVRNNTTSTGPTYNIQEWGIKTSAS